MSKERITYDVYESGNFVFHKLLLDGKELVSVGFYVESHGTRIDEDSLGVSIDANHHKQDWKIENINMKNERVKVKLVRKK